MNISGASVSMTQLILSRALAGISAAGMVSLVSVIMTGRACFTRGQMESDRLIKWQMLCLPKKFPFSVITPISQTSSDAVWGHRLEGF